MQRNSSTVVITAAVPRELNESASELAKATDRSKSAVIRQALAGHIEREKREAGSVQPRRR